MTVIVDFPLKRFPQHEQTSSAVDRKSTARSGSEKRIDTRRVPVRASFTFILLAACIIDEVPRQVF